MQKLKVVRKITGQRSASNLELNPRPLLDDKVDSNFLAGAVPICKRHEAVWPKGVPSWIFGPTQYQKDNPIGNVSSTSIDSQEIVDQDMKAKMTAKIVPSRSKLFQVTPKQGKL